MAAIEYSLTLYDTCLVLTPAEARRILPLVLKETARAREKKDYYQDVIEGGYATRKEETLCMKYEESFIALNDIAQEIEKLIKN